MFYIRFGNPEIKERFLRPSIAGDVVSAIGVSEAGAGSDVASKSSQACISRHLLNIEAHSQLEKVLCFI